MTSEDTNWGVSLSYYEKKERGVSLNSYRREGDPLSLNFQQSESVNWMSCLVINGCDPGHLNPVDGKCLIPLVVAIPDGLAVNQRKGN